MSVCVSAMVAPSTIVIAKRGAEGLLYYVLASSATLIEALQRVARYSSIANEGIALKCVDGKAIRISVRYVGVSRHLDRHQIEFWMAALVRFCRQLTGLRLRPQRVRLTHRRPQNAELAEFFGGDVEFGTAADEWRMTQARKIYMAGLVFAKEVQCQVEWLVLWRRVAGGLNAGQQQCAHGEQTGRQRDLEHGTLLDWREREVIQTM